MKNRARRRRREVKLAETCGELRRWPGRPRAALAQHRFQLAELAPLGLEPRAPEQRRRPRDRRSWEESMDVEMEIGHCWAERASGRTWVR